MSSKQVAPSDIEELAEKQIQHYSDAIGHSVPQRNIANVLEFAQTAQPHKVYSRFAEIRFLYEMLPLQDVRDQVLTLINAWVEVCGPSRGQNIPLTWLIQNGDNIKRAAQHVRREPKHESNQLVKAYCLFRLKARDGVEWHFLGDHGYYGVDEVEDQQPQTVAYIALTQLNRYNGFFVDLEPGQDVCVDSAAKVAFPPTGGGLGICICLKL